MPAVVESISTASQLLQLGWVELVGHALHYGVLLAGVVGVLLLLVPGLLPRRRPQGDPPPRPAGRPAARTPDPTRETP